MKIACGFFVSALLLLGGEQMAQAEEPDGLLRRGAMLRTEGKDAEALRLFEQADRARPTPTSKAQIGLAEQALGLWGRAELHVGESLRAEQDSWIRKNREALENALITIRQHLGDLELFGGEPGAEIFVDGAKVGTMPLSAPLRLEIGRRQLEVRQVGFHTARRVVEIGDQRARETLTMVPLASNLQDEPKRGIQAPERMQDAAIPQSRTQVTVGAVLLGASAGSAIFGGVSLLVRESITQSFNGNPRCDAPELAAECREQVASRSMWTTLAVGSFLASGAFAVAGGALLITAPAPRRRGAASHPETHCYAALLSGGAGWVCGGTL